MGKLDGLTDEVFEHLAIALAMARMRDGRHCFVEPPLVFTADVLARMPQAMLDNLAGKGRVYGFHGEIK